MAFWIQNVNSSLGKLKELRMYIMQGNVLPWRPDTTLTALCRTLITIDFLLSHNESPLVRIE